VQHLERVRYVVLPSLELMTLLPLDPFRPGRISHPGSARRQCAART